MQLRILLSAILLSAAAWAQRPLQLADILSWKRLQSPAVSNNGEWLAYRLSPARAMPKWCSAI